MGLDRNDIPLCNSRIRPERKTSSSDKVREALEKKAVEASISSQSGLREFRLPIQSYFKDSRRIIQKRYTRTTPQPKSTSSAVSVRRTTMSGERR